MINPQEYLFSIVVIASIATQAFAQTPSPCELSATVSCAKFSVAQLLEKETAHLVSSGFRPTDGDRIAIIDKGGIEEFHVELEVGVDYAIIAACGHICGHVEVRMLNEQQDPIAASTEQQQVVILNGAPSARGTYVVTIAAPGCEHIFCGIGLAIVRK